MGSFAFDPGDANRAFATTRICNVGATGIPGVIVAGDGKTDANGAGDYPKGGATRHDGRAQRYSGKCRCTGDRGCHQGSLNDQCLCR